MHRVGTVIALWRYPVKSMRGEPLRTAAFDSEGMVGDRRFAFASTAAPPGKPLLSSRERTAMLLYAPRLEPTPTVATPDGRSFPLPSNELTAALQTALQALSQPGVANGSHDGTELTLLAAPNSPFTDVRPVSLVSEATLEAVAAEKETAVDPQCFRSNIVLSLDSEEPFAEDTWTAVVAQPAATIQPAATLHFGAIDANGFPAGLETRPTLLVQERIPRCRMVSLDPETATPDPALLRLLAQRHAGRLGIYASVLRPGTLHVGDTIFLQSPGEII